MFSVSLSFPFFFFCVVRLNYRMILRFSEEETRVMGNVFEGMIEKSKTSDDGMKAVEAMKWTSKETIDFLKMVDVETQSDGENKWLERAFQARFEKMMEQHDPDHQREMTPSSISCDVQVIEQPRETGLVSFLVDEDCRFW